MANNIVPGDLVTYFGPWKHRDVYTIFDPNTFTYERVSTDEPTLGIVLAVYEVPIATRNANDEAKRKKTTTYCDVLFSEREYVTSHGECTFLARRIAPERLTKVS